MLLLLLLPASAAPVAPTGLGAEAAANAKLPLGISTAETRKGGEKPVAAKPAVAPEEMMPMVVDESGNEVDPRTGERVKKQEDFEPTPAPVAEAPAPAPATEKLEATTNDDDDDDDGFMTAEQLKVAASKSGLDAVIKKRKSVLEIRKPPPGKGPQQEPQRSAPRRRVDWTASKPRKRSSRRLKLRCRPTCSACWAVVGLDQMRLTSARKMKTT